MTPHAEILRLARSGSRERAWARFVALGYDARDDDPAALTLKGRLLKDRASAQDGGERAATYRAAGDAYAAAARIAPGSYPLINAATLALLAGAPAEARERAQAVLDLIARDEGEPETPYWLEATRAEALLLLGRAGEARAALGAAIATAPQAWEDHAATIAQFTLILGALDERGAWLEAYRPPPSLHFQGMMGLAADDSDIAERVAHAVEAVAPGFGIGALAAGADILAAEAIVARGAQLHVVLPCDPARFRAQSVVVAGEPWGPRFDRMLEAAESVETLGTAAASRAAVTACDEAAMGLALINARLLQSHAEALVVHDGRGPSAATATWIRHGNPVTEIVAPRAIAIEQPPGWTSAIAVALAWLPNAARLPSEPHLWSETVEGGTVIAYASPAQAARAALELDEGLPAAIDYGVIGEDAARRELVDRVTALGRGAGPGVAASGAMAWALALHCPDLAIEPAGELRWSGGPTPAYVVARD